MGLADVMNKEDRVEVTMSKLYMMLKEGIKAELITNAIRCDVPNHYINEMITGEPAEPSLAEEPEREVPRKDDLEMIIAHYGPDAQIIKTIEEFSELTVELAKDMNSQGDIERILEEIADVLVMLEQLQLIYKFDWPSVEAISNEKINRTLNRIDYENRRRDNENIISHGSCSNDCNNKCARRDEAE